MQTLTAACSMCSHCRDISDPIVPPSLLPALNWNQPSPFHPLGIDPHWELRALRLNEAAAQRCRSRRLCSISPKRLLTMSASVLALQALLLNNSKKQFLRAQSIKWNWLYHSWLRAVGKCTLWSNYFRKAAVY